MFQLPVLAPINSNQPLMHADHPDEACYLCFLSSSVFKAF